MVIVTIFLISPMCLQQNYKLHRNLVSLTFKLEAKHHPFSRLSGVVGLVIKCCWFGNGYKSYLTPNRMCRDF